MGRWFFLDFRERLFEKYAGVFGGGTGSDKQQQFSKRWGWYSILMSICGDDVLKIDEATEININKTFTYLSYLKDKERVSK